MKLYSFLMMLILAATNVWVVEMDKEKQQLVYYLEPHKEPRYRAVFKMIPIKK